MQQLQLEHSRAALSHSSKPQLMYRLLHTVSEESGEYTVETEVVHHVSRGFHRKANGLASEAHVFNIIRKRAEVRFLEKKTLPQNGPNGVTWGIFITHQVGI